MQFKNETGNMSQKLMNPGLSLFKDKKRLAWVFYSILKNNIVSGPMLYVLLIIENIELFLLFLIQVSQYHTNKDYEDSSIHHSIFDIFKDIGLFTDKMLNDISFNIYFQTVFVLFVICKNIFIYTSMVLIALKCDSPEKAKQSNVLSKVLSFVFQFVNKVMFTPKMIFLIYFFRNTDMALSSRILFYAGCLVAIFASIFLEVVLTPIFNVRIKMPQVLPWCMQHTFIPYAKSIFKLSQSICLVIKIPNLAIAMLFIIQGFIMISEILILPYHNKIVQQIQIFGSTVLFAQYSLLILELLIGFNYDVTLAIFFLSFFAPIFVNIIISNRQENLKLKLLNQELKSVSEVEQALHFYSNVILESYNNPDCLRQLNGLLISHQEYCQKNSSCFCIDYEKSMIASKSLNTQLRLKYEKQNRRYNGIEIESLRQQYHQNQIKKVQNQNQQQMQLFQMKNAQDDQTSQNQSELSNLHSQKLNQKDLNHIQGSSKVLVYSQYNQNSDAVNSITFKNPQIFKEDIQNENVYNSQRFADDDQNKTDNVIQNLMIKLPKVQIVQGSYGVDDANMRERELVEEEMRSYKRGTLNTLFTNEQLVLQGKKEKVKNQNEKDLSLLSIQLQTLLKAAEEDEQLDYLDYQSIKIQTLVNILYEKVKYYSEFYSNNLKMMMFKAYFELFIKKKKYLCYQTLTKINVKNTSLLNYTMFLIDQQFMIEQANLLFKANDEDLLDVEKLTIHNSAYQEFYDFNKETSYLLNNFWSMLRNSQSIDIDSLYKAGVNTSDMIKKTKSKFNQLCDLGIDKRNCSLYYLYANFNKFVLNSNDLHEEFMHKMKQIRSMNRTIKENYQEMLNLDVDKAGFIMVNGSFQSFGKILFANQKACALLNYLPEQIIGNMINVLMPLLISEKHNHFISIFRENGVTRFIQRQQYLFMKNSEGYIIPMKVYIKFHYDKVYGHVFVAVMNKVKHAYPFTNKKKYNHNEILCFLTDECGTITEITPSVTKLLGIPLQTVLQNVSSPQESIQIEQLFNFRIDQLEMSHNKEIITHINPDFSQDETQAFRKMRGFSSKGIQTHTWVKTTNDNDSQDEQMDVCLKMVSIYHKSILAMKYFFVEILGDSVLQMIDPNQIEFTLAEKPQLTVQQADVDVQELMARIGNGDERSGSSTSSSNSRKLMNEFIEKDIDSLIRNDSRTPKILKQILLLVAVLIFSIMIISAVIMGLYITESSHTSINIDNIVYQLNKIIVTCNSMNLLRSLINFNMGIENKSLLSNSLIWKDKFNDNDFNYNSFIRNKVVSQMDEIQKMQQNIDQFDIEVVEEQDNIINTYNSLRYEIILSNVNQQGLIETQRQTTSIAIKLLLSNILEIITKVDKIRLTNINSSTYIFSDYQSNFIRSVAPMNTSQEMLQMNQQIFFVFYNFINAIDKNAELQVQLFLDISTHQLKENGQQKILIMSMISIAAILVILLAISPIILKIRRSKYQVLLFFVNIDKKITEECSKKSQIFENHFYQEDGKKLDFDSHNFKQNENNYENESQSHLGQEGNDKIKNFKELEDMTDFSQFSQSKNQLDNLQNDPKLKKIRDTNKNQLTRVTTHFGHSDFDQIDHSDIFDKEKLSDLQGELSLVQDSSFHDLLQTNQEQIKSEKINITQQFRQISFPGSHQSSSNLKGRNPIVYQFHNQQIQSKHDKKIDFSSIQLTPIEEENNLQLGEQNYLQRFDTHFARNVLKIKETESNESLYNSRINNNSADNSVELNHQQNVLFQGNRMTTLNDIKQSNQTMLQTQDEVQAKDNEDESIANKILNISTTQKSSIIAQMISLFILFSGYFIGIYVFTLLTTRSFKDSFIDLNMIYQREYCSSKLFYLTREDFLQNLTAKLIDYSKQEDIYDSSLKSGGYDSLSMRQLWKCMQIEQSYANLKRTHSSYLSDANSMISDLDTKKLCDIIQQTTDFTKQQCSGVLNSMLLNGMLLTRQEITKSLLLSQLEFFNQQSKNRTTDYILQKLRNHGFMEQYYVNTLMFYEVDRLLNKEVYDSVISFITNMNSVHIGLFTVLVVVSISLAIYFFFYMYQMMRSDMLNSHTMLAMLPKQLLEKKDQIKIKEFLMS